MPARLVLAALAAVAVVFAVLALVIGRSTPAAEPASNARAAVLATAAARPAASGRSLELGVEHRYRVELAHTSRTQAGDLFALAITGEWALVPVSTDAHGTTTVRAELRDARARINQQDAPDTRLAVPYAFTLAPDGRLVALQVPRDLDAETRAVLTALTATAQLADGGRATTWTAIETDSLGPFDARYTRDGATVRKAKVAYRARTGGEPLAIEVVDSATVAALRPDGWPADLDHREHLRVGVDQLSVSVEGRVRLRHAGTGRAAAALPADLEAVAIDAASRANTDASDRELLDGATFADLLAELARVRDDGNASGHQYLRLVALFRLDAEAARSAGRAVVAGTLDPRDAAAVIGALGEAGTRDAQTALTAVVDTRTVAHDARVHGALALGLTPSPLPETLAVLASASRATGDADLAATATLALGNAALRLRAHDAAAATAQLEDLLARLRAAPDDDARMILLRALGNTGDARILPALEIALSSQRDVVRAAAAESLRLIPDAHADALVIAGLGDRSPVVRASAVLAASHRAPAPLAAALAVTARTDPEVTVRRAIVELAATRMNELAELRAIVEHAAQRDRDPELRAAAAGLLAPA